VAVSYRNKRLTEESDNSEGAGSPSTVNFSPLRVGANDDSPISDASYAVNAVSLGQSQSIGPEPIYPVSQESTDKLSFIVDLLLKNGPIEERKFKVGLHIGITILHLTSLRYYSVSFTLFLNEMTRPFGRNTRPINCNFKFNYRNLFS
jgi:hypothetical protein